MLTEKRLHKKREQKKLNRLYLVSWRHFVGHSKVVNPTFSYVPVAMEIKRNENLCIRVVNKIKGFFRQRSMV